MISEIWLVERVKSTPFTVRFAFDADWIDWILSPEKSDETVKALSEPFSPTSWRRKLPDPVPVLTISALTPRSASLMAVCMSSREADSTEMFSVAPPIVMLMVVVFAPLMTALEESNPSEILRCSRAILVTLTLFVPALALLVTVAPSAED